MTLTLRTLMKTLVVKRASTIFALHYPYTIKACAFWLLFSLIFLQ